MFSKYNGCWRKKALKEFIQLWVEDSLNFESIKNQKISTFAEKGLKINKRVNDKIQDVKIQWKMFERLLMASFKEKLIFPLFFDFR